MPRPSGGPPARDLSFLVLLLAAVCMCACFGSKGKPVEKKSMDELLDDLSTGNDGAKTAAVRRLGTIGGRAAVGALTVALNDSSERVRTAAARALGETKDPTAADALAIVMEDPKRTRELRLACALARADLGDPRAAPLLVAGLSTANEDASAALRRLGKPAVPALIDGLREQATRKNASKVLISMGPAGIDALIDLMHKSDVSSERQAAAGTLAEMDDPRATEALNEALKQAHSEFASVVYRYFIRRGQPGTEAQLIDTLNSFGTLPMAEDFISSGNAALKTAGENWARKRNFALAVRTSEMDKVYWGGEDPSIKRLALFHFDNSLNSASGTAPSKSNAASFVPGKFGTAVSIGENGALTYPLAGNLSFRDGTIEMWIAPKFSGSDPVYSKHNHVLVLYQSTKGEQFILAETTQGGFYAGTFIRGVFRGTGGGNFSNWQPGIWHHIAFTYSSSPARQRLYLDGKQVGDDTGSMPEPNADAGVFAVGSNPFGPSSAFGIDELVIFSGAKSANDIQRSASRQEPFADR